MAKNTFLDTTAKKTLGRTYEVSGQFVDKMIQRISWTSLHRYHGAKNYKH